MTRVPASLLIEGFVNRVNNIDAEGVFFPEGDIHSFAHVSESKTNKIGAIVQEIGWNMANCFVNPGSKT
jgi:hypothetical protein